jgi:F-type H+-transporting ATPase subunit gamma
MPTNKELVLRIKGVQATQKITKAMKMVAASKLKKARLKIANATLYYENMRALVANLIGSDNLFGPQIMRFLDAGANQYTHLNQYVHLVIVAGSNRGLCGAFNSSIIKAAKAQINHLRSANKQVQIICLGGKIYEQLKISYDNLIIHNISFTAKEGVTFADALDLRDKIINLFNDNKFEVCSIIYHQFKSAINQQVTLDNLIPLTKTNIPTTTPINYECEPEKEQLLLKLLPHYLAVAIFYALITNEAAEQSLRMQAMENASKNASEMIGDLTTKYNTSRQSAITTELVEIIAGTNV